MNSIQIKGNSRSEFGKKAAAAIRREGSVPCNISGGKESIRFSADLKSFKNLIYTHEFKVATIEVDGKSVNAVVKEIQFDPITDKIKHIDFIELTENKKITLQIPLSFVGTPAGAKEGGKVLQKVRRLDVRLTPEYIVPSLSINVEKLEMGDTVKVKDLKFDNIEILNAPYMTVVEVNIPRLAKEEVVAPVAAAVVAEAAPVAGAPAAPGAAPAAAPEAKPAAKK
jgi:large subunit ribosomal protein L25